MSTELIPYLALCIFVVAMLYASVGHGGASGYLALMALFSLHPEALKPTALLLNIVVAGVGTYLYCTAGQFSWAAVRCRTLRDFRPRWLRQSRT